MTKQEKNEVIEVLKGKFSQYSNFYITDTESLTVAQVTDLRRHCFDKQVEMKVAKNTLIRKALEGIDAEKYTGVYDSLHKVTALLFSENPKEPALILAGFRKKSKGEKPELKAAFNSGFAPLLFAFLKEVIIKAGSLGFSLNINAVTLCKLS